MQSKLAQCSYVLYNLFDTLCSTVVFPPIFRIPRCTVQLFPSNSLPSFRYTVHYNTVVFPPSYRYTKHYAVQFYFLPSFRYTFAVQLYSFPPSFNTLYSTLEFPPIFQIHCTVYSCITSHLSDTQTLCNTILFPPINNCCESFMYFQVHIYINN